MIFKSLKKLTFIFFIFQSIQGHAQYNEDDQSDLQTIDACSHFEVGLDISNKLISAGRDWGIHGMAFAPMVMYKNRSGLYGYVIPNVWTDSVVLKQTKIPDIEIGVGYGKSFRKAADVDIYYSHDFLTYGNSAFRKSFINNLSFESVFYLGNIVDAGANFYLSFSRGNKKNVHERFASDLELFIKKEIEFDEIIGAKRVMMTPRFSMNAGSDRVALARKNHTIISGNGSNTSNKFWGLLDTEASMDFEWRIKHWALNINPTYILPFNLNVNDRNNQAGKGIYYLDGGFTFYLFQKDKI